MGKRRRLTRTARLIVGATGSLAARIRAKTVRAGRLACWTWTGATSLKRGGARRPHIRVGGGGAVVLVARVLLALLDGVPLAERIAAGLEAGHRCGHFWCVNPHHLEWQTREQNEQAKHEFDEFDRFSREIDDAIAGEAA